MMRHLSWSLRLVLVLVPALGWAGEGGAGTGPHAAAATPAGTGDKGPGASSLVGSATHATPEVPLFGEGMTRPERLSGPAPRYTQEAMAARVQGLVIARCTITTEGEARDCALIKPLPYLGDAVLESLQASRFKPATLQGKPLSVRYVVAMRVYPPRTSV